MKKKCPFCGQGVLTRGTKEIQFEFRGQATRIGQPGEYCDVCEEGIVHGHDIKMTQLSIHNWQAQVEGFLPTYEVRRIRKKLGLTQRDAAKIFGGGPNAFSRYENGEALQIKATDNLLRLLDRHPHLLSEIKIEKEETAA